jgi:hypothetical protein
VCTALDQCHTVGTCDPSTGLCSNPAKNITCTPLDQCHAAGTCDPSTGLCTTGAYTCNMMKYTYDVFGNVIGQRLDTCTPTSCSTQGKTCGSIPDGCQGTLSCGGCPAGWTCGASNVCQCAAGFTYCSPTSTCNDLTSDPSACGSCGHVCPGIANGYAICSSSQCSGVRCNAGYCMVNGQCSSVDSDPNNCGFCGQICPGTANGYATCAASQCGLACNAGYALCGGQCVNLSSDLSNCGGCGIVCSGYITNYCINGSCGPCPAGYAACCGGDACRAPGQSCPSPCP